MPIAIGGLSSGLDTNDIIDKYLQVEAKPIEQWQVDKDRCSLRKNALEELRSRLTELNDSARDLYGFRASYDEKKAISSNPEIIEATANKLAEKGIKKIKVKELASTHKIATDRVPSDKEISSGKFNIEVNGESRSFKFKGGSLANLRDKLSESVKDIVDIAYIKADAENNVLTIESKVPGKKGEIILTGDKDFLKEIGLVTGEKGEKTEEVKIVFDRKFFTAYTGKSKIPEEDGSLDVSQDGRSITIEGVLWREFVLPASSPVQKDTVLEVSLDYNKVTEKEEAVPYKIEIGPEDEITIKGIKLKSYNIPRIRPPEKEKDKEKITDVVGIGVIAAGENNGTEKIYKINKDIKGMQAVEIGKDFNGKSIGKVIFYCNDGTANFSDARITTPVKGTGVLEAKNTIKNASDAKLELDGIEIVRDSNNNLNDVIKGVNLNLKNSSDKHVTLRIEPDIDKSVDKIHRFVKAYNNYLELNSLLVKTSKIDKPNKDSSALDKARNRNEIGLFVGDMTILRLENSLKTAIGNAYPGMTQNPVKILPQTGISTGAINSSWESIKEGKLVVDENVLRETIDNNPEGVNDFFGSDTDGDNRIDNGMAYNMETLLKPFLMSGNNIIALMINLENESIKSTDEKIDKHREHLKIYEEKLRSKFASMEKSVSDSKAQGNWFKMNMGIQDNESKNK